MITQLVRNMYSGKSDDFTFRHYNNGEHISFNSNSGLYIHIPFCENFCPYCPYYKIRYNKDTALEYKKALIKEIDLYYEMFGPVTFSSLYIGGGTPTLMTDEIGEVLEHINKRFKIKGSLGIETNPRNIDKDTARKLKSLGFNLISLGIQSFNNDVLRKIGRNYNSDTAMNSLGDVLAENFDTVNLDMMFVIDGQTIDDIESDLTKAIKNNVDQITCYPLFTFPYSEFGEFKKLKKMKLPNNRQRKKMYYFIHEFLKSNHYDITSVWSFNKSNGETYSSVTRDYYLGLGASSGSYNGEFFYFNTFSVSEYNHRVNQKLPISVKMNVSPRLEKVFWLYWRLYETVVLKSVYKEMFNCDIDKDFGIVLKFMRLLGFVEYEDINILKLNIKGAHWIHLIQNHYALDYVTKVWSASKNNPWPEKIKL